MTITNIKQSHSNKKGFCDFTEVLMKELQLLGHKSRDWYMYMRNCQYGALHLQGGCLYIWNRKWFYGSFLIRWQYAILWRNGANGDRLWYVACFLKVYVVTCDVLLWNSVGPLWEVSRKSIAFIDFYFVGIGPKLSSNWFLYMAPIILNRCYYVPWANLVLSLFDSFLGNRNLVRGFDTAFFNNRGGSGLRFYPHVLL